LLDQLNKSDSTVLVPGGRSYLSMSLTFKPSDQARSENVRCTRSRALGRRRLRDVLTVDFGDTSPPRHEPRPCVHSSGQVERSVRHVSKDKAEPDPTISMYSPTTPDRAVDRVAGGDHVASRLPLRRLRASRSPMSPKVHQSATYCALRYTSKDLDGLSPLH